MIIPTDRLSPDALRGLMEEFISREGTDYGHHEYTLEQKLKQVQGQLDCGEVLIVFDAASESCTLLPRDQAQEWLS